MPQLFTNNAVSTLASGISAGAASVTVQAADGALFPNPSGSDFFLATIQDASNNIEIVRVTARSTDTFTITRAQEGTTARAWLAGDVIELRMTAGTLSQFRQGVGDSVLDRGSNFSIGLANAHDIFNCTAAVTATLGDAATLGAGFQVLVKNSSAGIVTISRATGGDTMNGAASDIFIMSGRSAYISVNENVDGFIACYELNGGYPVGSIFLSTVATNPATLLGFGTWAQIAQGRTLIGEGTGSGLTARTAGAEGGAEDAIVPEHTHTITDPGHSHDSNIPQSSSSTGSGGASGSSSGADPQTSTEVTGITVDNAGVDATDGNMQPYLVVYIWERTA